MVYTTTAFEAAAAFANNKGIAAAVSWSPDIYNLPSQDQGNRMLVNTQTANKLIADVWFARADFANDHPGIIEGLVRGIFDADGTTEELREQQAGVQQADGRRLQHPRGRRAGHVQRRPQHELGGELPVLLEPEQPHELRAASGGSPTTYIASIRSIENPAVSLRHRSWISSIIAEAPQVNRRYADPKRTSIEIEADAQGSQRDSRRVWRRFSPTRSSSTSIRTNSWDLHKKIFQGDQRQVRSRNSTTRTGRYGVGRRSPS